MIPSTTFALIILDGWGYRKDSEFNAIAAANTPHWDHLWQNYPHGFVDASGLSVGLPENQMGNSEVGHLHMGAGRHVYQDLTRIDQSIATKEFFNNAILTKAFEDAEKNNRAIHVLGLLSPGGVHSHENHLHAILDMAAARNFKNIWVHAFLDGRDTPPKSAMQSIKDLTEKYHANIASIIGRYYAMDRDKRWDRVQAAYQLLVEGKASFTAHSAQEALEAAYARGETDEFVQPTCILNPNLPRQNKLASSNNNHHLDPNLRWDDNAKRENNPITINDGDSVIFFNFRSDRARELSHALIENDFKHFEKHKHVDLKHFITFAEYAKDIPSEVVFPTNPLTNMLGDYLSQHHCKQLRLAETEKYAHVTFFFNGGVETTFPGESRILVPSPHVTTYDLVPEMSAYEVTEQLVNAIKKQTYQFIVCNFANPDMVGHTGNFAATVKAIEVIDECLGRIFCALKDTQSEAIITADHGNAELMFDSQTQQAHTAHTCEPVPFIYIGRPAQATQEIGSLVDIAPTMLHLMGLAQPKEMTGKSLITIIPST